MAAKVNPQLHPSWLEVLKEEFDKAYFLEIKQFLKSEMKAGKAIYPPAKLIFNAFDLTPFDQLKVVILGQDPYHNVGQAHGLSFSVPHGVRTPHSLRNVYKELNQDLDLAIPTTGNLETWAKQGVFLLNAMLTVEARKPASHQKIGWQNFTDGVIRTISAEKEGVIFLLWGNFAKKKKALINLDKHHVLEAVHPSPLAGNRFLGCRHFSRTNELLIQQGKTPIDWRIVAE